MLWLDIVNAAFEWSGEEDAELYLRKLLQTTKLSSNEVRHFWHTLRFMREQLSAAHFGERLDVQSINQRLAKLKLEFATKGRLLPALRSALPDNNPLHQLEQTVFLQFVIHLSEIQAASDDRQLRRCEGFYNPEKSLQLLADEQRWRSEIPEFSQLAESNSNWQRCGDFFISARGRFCSEACRTRAFQIAKQVNDPQYLSNKQRRYRVRKASADK